jgi:hypothetical protein
MWPTGNRLSLSELQNADCGSYEKAVGRTTVNMHPIAISILLGLTAAGANVFGGAIIVQRNWERRYLRYFVALGAGFMLATALVEMVPERLAAAGIAAPPFLISARLSDHSLLRAHGHAALSFWRRDSQR